ncbi:hypothetical protein H4W19_07470 [Pseudoxanthomonas mexicana]|uniref:Uncharacterized protein n=1 Tax=Pseudoxanthomonas mexicana TaxID=128785 RepID=A0ABX6RFU7_PSEMX|nr:hypothetical protein [Pseudoxanthomonas mexicana]QLQ28682.1 MAG: hypothetical protein HZT39_10770 [Pseudoxanthomonas sp.]QND81570.1 hypothetical protein H4W19_07470 [Pseudoxanthomonas mexicana]
MRTLTTLAVSAVLLASCSADRESSSTAPRKYFAANKSGASPDYGIIKFGNSDDHVITVHGFMDDAASCKEVVEALNTNACNETAGQQCLNPYSCIALNE